MYVFADYIYSYLIGVFSSVILQPFCMRCSHLKHILCYFIKKKTQQKMVVKKEMESYFLTF